MLHHVPTAQEQDEIFAEVNRVLRPGGVFVGVDSLEGQAIRAGHVDDVFNPVDPETLGTRLEAAGFDHVGMEERQGQVRFHALKPETTRGRGRRSLGSSRPGGAR